jgi:hypothetical protein
VKIGRKNSQQNYSKKSRQKCDTSVLFYVHEHNKKLVSWLAVISYTNLVNLKACWFLEFPLYSFCNSWHWVLGHMPSTWNEISDFFVASQFSRSNFRTSFSRLALYIHSIHMYGWLLSSVWPNISYLRFKRRWKKQRCWCWWWASCQISIFFGSYSRCFVPVFPVRKKASTPIYNTFPKARQKWEKWQK